MVVQNERDSQVLALSKPRLQFHPEYGTPVVMILQKLDKVKRTKRVLAFSLNRIDGDGRDLAWWSDRIRSRRRFAGLLHLHFPLPQPVAVRTYLQKSVHEESKC